MDRFVLREPRTGTGFPQDNQMITITANAGGTNMIPQETIYFSGPFVPDLSNVQRTNSTIHSSPYNLNAQYNMNTQLGPSAQYNMNAQHDMNAQLDPKAQYVNAQQIAKAHHKMNAQHVANAQNNMNAQQDSNAWNNPNAQHNNNAQHNTFARHKINAQQNMLAQHNMFAQQQMSRQPNPQMDQQEGKGLVSGIDPRYLAGHIDNSEQFVLAGQQIQRNAPINTSFGSDYQNRSIDGMDRNKQKNFAPQVVSTVPQLKKPKELDLLKTDTQNQVMTRADKLKALYKSGPRAFSGPVEKVLKWHKSLQDIGVLVFYEIVAKCVSVRPGDSCSKNLVVRDDNGPAMQVVYYEIDFLLPELKPPCTIRVIGRMMAGTCRLQAFNVRPATGDDVATLPRRAAVAAHHVAKLCKEYGPNVV